MRNTRYIVDLYQDPVIVDTIRIVASWAAHRYDRICANLPYGPCKGNVWQTVIDIFPASHCMTEVPAFTGENVCQMIRPSARQFDYLDATDFLSPEVLEMSTGAARSEQGRGCTLQALL
jgi:hypothetical protein